jgi:fucose 4-O-acetylase-like acetyltransferase
MKGDFIGDKGMLINSGVSVSPTGPPQRLEWPDLAKGMAMILVVTGHVLGGLMAGNFIPEAPWGRRVYEWIYLFHVPTLFFVSGWLVEFRTKSKGLTPMKTFLATLMYPYFLWGIIIWAVHLAGSSSGVANVPVDPWVPLRMFYAASAGPWFLFVLFLFHALNHLLRVVRNRPVWLMAIGLGAFIDYACCSFIEFDTTRCRFEANVVFYALGVWVAAKGGLLDPKNGNKMTLLIGAALLALLGWGCWRIEVLSPWLRLPLGMIGIAGIICLSFALAELPGTKWLGWLGWQSLAIYVLHGFLPPVVRWLLTRQLEVTNAWVLLLTGVTAGLLFSAATAWAVNHWQFGWVFSCGRRQNHNGVKLT